MRAESSFLPIQLKSTIQKRPTLFGMHKATGLRKSFDAHFCSEMKNLFFYRK